MGFSRTSTRPIAVGVAVCLAAGFLGGGVASASIGEVAKAPAPTNCRKASGPFKVSGIKVLGAKGKVFVPYGTTVTGMAPGTNDSPDPTSAEQQITGAYKYWCVNTVRIQVSQESLVGKSGTSFSSGFLAQLKHVVSVAEGYGLVVVISDQTETAGLQPGPTAATASFWQHLAKAFGGSKQVIFDLFNEPRVAAGSTSRDWQVWQRGGTVKGVAYIGMKSLVADVRGDGARNLFWVEGPFSASTLAQAGSHLVGDRAGVVYDIHHPGGAHDAGAWNSDFGYLVTRHIAAVVDGEWTNYANSTGECWGRRAPSEVPAYLAYLAKIGVGATVWTLKEGVMLRTSQYWQPTEYLSSPWSCADLDQGAGLDVMTWYKRHNRVS